MAEDNRLIEIMADLLAEVREMRIDLRDFKNVSVDRFERLEQQQAKTNLALGEVRLSVMRLADKIEEIYHLDQRVRVLENIVLPQPPMKAA